MSSSFRNILQVSKLYPPFFGGIETVVYDLSTELKKNGHSVDILCVADKNVSEYGVYEDINVIRCASVAHVASTYISLEFVYQWKNIRNNYDIIHLHLPNPLAILALSLFPTRAKVVVHWHSDIVKQKYLKIPFLPFQKSILNKASKIVVTSPNYGDSSTDLVNFKQKLVTIPIGIDVDGLASNPKTVEQIKKANSGRQMVFALGRHIYYKGFENLIRSVKHLNSNPVIIIGGEGELTSRLAYMIKSEGVSDSVKLVGKIPFEQLGSYYEASDVFCLPSILRSEAFGVVQLEAMSKGKPVISTNIPGSGVSWVNQNGVTGYVVECDSPKALAQGIDRVLIDNNFKREEIESYFSSQFTRCKMAKEFEKLYHAL